MYLMIGFILRDQSHFANTLILPQISVFRQNTAFSIQVPDSSKAHKNFCGAIERVQHT
jgi:hypothetical protein